MANPDYDKENKGSLFINKDKEKLKDERDTSNWSDMQGYLDVFGFKLYISGWSKIIQSGDNQGDKMLSLSVQAQDEDEGKKLKKFIKEEILNESLDSDEDLEDIKDMDDDLPF